MVRYHHALQIKRKIMSVEIISPSSSYYKRSECCNKRATFFLLVASIIIAAGLLLPGCIINHSNWYYMKVIQILSVVAYQSFTLASTILNFRGRKVKINDLVDNAFGSNHSDKHSVGYYDNDDANEGIVRYYLNSAESCFFSMRETEYMQKTVYSKSALLLILIGCALFSRNTDFILAIFQITILFTIIISTVKFVVVLNELHRLFDRMDTALKKKGNKQQVLTDAINYSLEYETIIAWFSTKLPDSVYLANNKSLTLEWNKRKRKYKI